MYTKNWNIELLVRTILRRSAYFAKHYLGHQKSSYYSSCYSVTISPTPSPLPAGGRCTMQLGNLNTMGSQTVGPHATYHLPKKNYRPKFFYCLKFLLPEIFLSIIFFRPKFFLLLKEFLSFYLFKSNKYFSGGKYTNSNVFTARLFPSDQFTRHLARHCLVCWYKVQWTTLIWTVSVTLKELKVKDCGWNLGSDNCIKNAKKKILASSVLIRYWRSHKGEFGAKYTRLN